MKQIELTDDNQIVMDRPNLVVSYGLVTLQIPGAANKHYTYRVHIAKRGALEGKRLVSLLIGSDNRSDYKAFGFVNEDGTIAVWRKYRGTNFDKHARALVNPPEGTRVWEAARCCKCNQWLTNPESVALGIGPKCGGRA